MVVLEVFLVFQLLFMNQYQAEVLSDKGGGNLPSYHLAHKLLCRWPVLNFLRLSHFEIQLYKIFKRIKKNNKKKTN